MQISETQYRVAMYIRLSKDDGDKDESNSVSNQRDFIRSFLERREELVLEEEYVDDGYSGVNFERPAVQRMFADMKKKKINCIIVKDLSRFGRNYIETGRYLEQVFPVIGIRFIAINDGYDSIDAQNQSNDIILPFKNLMNDAYSRDLSIKIRSQLEVRCKKGQFIGSFPAYGYQRSEEKKNQLEIDERAAEVVRNIFRWKIEGKNNKAIADYLNKIGVLSPMEYKRSLGFAYSTSFKRSAVAKWSAQTIGRILQNELYIGNLIQGKEGVPNYKVKKKRPKPKEEWIRVEHTHEPIISDEDFFLVQELLKQDTRMDSEQTEIYPLSGKMKCGFCGKNMIRKQVRTKEKRYTYYVCRTHIKERKKCPCACSVKEEDIKKSVLKVLQSHISTVVEIRQLLQDMELATFQEKEISHLKQRLQDKEEEYRTCKELSMGLYEDYKMRILSPDMYQQMKLSYEEKEGLICNQIGMLEKELEQFHSKKDKMSRWMERYQEYENITELNRKLVNLFIEKITVLNKNEIEVRFYYQDEFEEIVHLIKESATSNIES